jgi:hypothetical protein
MVFKKDLTPIGNGPIVKNIGKGGRQQVRGPGGSETLTGNPMQGMMNQYPKATPSPAVSDNDADDVGLG